MAEKRKAKKAAKKVETPKVTSDFAVISEGGGTTHYDNVEDVTKAIEASVAAGNVTRVRSVHTPV